MPTLNLADLKKLLSVPTSPFRERQVKDFFELYFAQHKVPHFEDSYGNIVVGAATPKEYRSKLRKKPTALKVIVAHMDHPVFTAKNGWARLKKPRV